MPAPSTTRASIPSTSTPSTPTSLAPAPEDGDGPSLIAVTPKNEPAGPPGGGLDVEGSGYSCEAVYFFFDGTRVGSDSPDAAGNVSKGACPIRGWFGMGPRSVPEPRTRSHVWSFLGLTAATAVACGFLSPDFGEVGQAQLPARQRDRDDRHGGGLSVVRLQPGFLYGALAGLAFRSALSERVQGKMTAASWVFSLVVSGGAFFLRYRCPPRRPSPGRASGGSPSRSVWP